MNSPPDNWKRNRVDLSQFYLSPDDKLWIGQKVVSKDFSVKELVDRYNLDAKLIYKYGKLFRRGIRPQDSAGRPQLLSEVRYENDRQSCQ